MLAAGLGKRLAKYTKNNTKCMVEVAGKKLIDRTIEAISRAGIKRFVIVTGYKAENLKNYILENYKGKLDFVFINNEVYNTTNNVYSFYLAKDELIKDDTILLESDLIYDLDLIKDVKNSPDKNVVTVAKYESWMDGTCVKLDENNMVHKFVEKQKMNMEHLDQYYKTVNIYKFDKQFLKDVYLPFLETFMKIQGLNIYYEDSLKYICQIPNIYFRAFLMNDRPWYEIDDAQDLDIANVLFSKGKEKYDLLQKHYGGFWRFPGYIDFCYLVNPYYPKENMVKKMQNEFPVLLTQYPSGLSVENMNAGRLFGIYDEHILVGNGAAELINALGKVLKNKTIAVNLPVFNEYVRCFKDSKIIEIDNSKNDYALSMKVIKENIDKTDYVAIVNPDNPSGFLLKEKEIYELCDYAKEKGKNLIIDESFVDFARKEERFTLIKEDFVEKYPNVIVVKSISKSFGVPGLRLGLLASGDVKLLAQIKEEMQIWNINSFAEYYLQIYQLFAKDYSEACDRIVEERDFLISELKKFKGVKVYSSSANYVMVDIGKHSATDLAIKLLEEHRLIIKDLSTKNKFENKNFIRLAVRDRHDNEVLIKCLKEYL